VGLLKLIDDEFELFRSDVELDIDDDDAFDAFDFDLVFGFDKLDDERFLMVIQLLPLLLLLLSMLPSAVLPFAGSVFFPPSPLSPPLPPRREGNGIITCLWVLVCA